MTQEPIWGREANEPESVSRPENVTNDKLNQMVAFTKERLRPLGAWSSATQYQPNDAVFDGNGAWWLALQPNQNSTPASNNANWKALGGGGSGAPSGGAGGVLSGSYPNPGFAVDMATQAELDAVAATKANDNAVVHKTGAESIAGVKTFSNAPLIPDPTADNEPTSRGWVKTYVGQQFAGRPGPGVQDVTALAAVPALQREDKQSRIVEDEGATFRFDAESTASAASGSVIVPSDVTPPAPGRWIKTSGGGINGADGNDGWTPVLAVVNDGARRVLQVTDWTSGEGTKPATGKYVGASGLVTAIADAMDIRGATGAQGAGVPTGGTTGQILAKTSGADNATGWIDAPSGGSGGAGNTALSIDVSSANSPLNLTSTQRAANTIIFTGTRSSTLDVIAGADGAWLFNNLTSQNILVRALSGSTKKATVANRAPRLVHTFGSDIYTGTLFQWLGAKLGLTALDSGNSINTSLLARWIFTEGSGTSAKNLVTGTNHALQGTPLPSWLSSGSDGAPALSMTNVSQSLSYGTLSKLTGIFTAFFRVRPLDFSSATYLYGDWDAGSANIICAMDTGGTLRFNSGSGSSGQQITTSALTSGQIVNIAFVRGATTIKIYIDGVEAVSAAKTHGGGSTSNTIGLLNADVNNSGFRGEVETVALWTRELSAAEIATLNGDPYMGLS